MQCSNFILIFLDKYTSWYFVFHVTGELCKENSVSFSKQGILGNPTEIIFSLAEAEKYLFGLVAKFKS